MHHAAARISPSTRVRDVMHVGVVSCDPRVSGVTVARVMAAHRIHSVVVVDGASPRIVTDLDLAGALYGDTLATATAAELAQPCPVVRSGDSVAGVVERLHERQTTHAIVADGSGRAIGVISILDLAEAVAADR